MPSGHDHIQAGKHVCSDLGLGRTSGRFYHCGKFRSRMLVAGLIFPEQLLRQYEIGTMEILLKFRLQSTIFFSLSFRRTQKFRGNAELLVHAGGESTILGVPQVVLRVDRRVVRHDRRANPRDGAADRHAA